MSDSVLIPVSWVRAIVELPFPSSVDDRLQELMDGNTEGQLTPHELLELEELVGWSQQMSLVKAQARIVLKEVDGRQG